MNSVLNRAEAMTDGKLSIRAAVTIGLSLGGGEKENGSR